MDVTYEIVAEADSVTEARQQAERQVPRGMQILALKEYWPSSGTARAAGDATASAQARARAQIPAGASVLSETLRPVGEVVYVFADDEGDAAERLSATYGEAVAPDSVGLSVDGRTESTPNEPAGPVGYLVGRSRYRAELRQPFAEVSYRTKARVALTFGPAPVRRSRLRPGA